MELVDLPRPGRSWRLVVWGDSVENMETINGIQWCSMVFNGV